MRSILRQAAEDATLIPGDGGLRPQLCRGSRSMNSGDISIFDLSPSEKLQLVEDLWDDLAATPETVPVHDWQKDELARRKANLMNNPASGLSWEQVKQYIRGRHQSGSKP